MKSRNYLLVLLSLTLTGMPALAVPFLPDDAPRCDSSVNRGAQNALDLHMTKLSNEEIKEYHENFRTSHRERMNNIMNEHPELKSTEELMECWMDECLSMSMLVNGLMEEKEKLPVNL